MERFILADERFQLEGQIRECFGRCAYTNKTHEKMAEQCASKLRTTKWIQIILSALATGGAVGVIFDKDSVVFPYVTAGLSIAILILNTYVKDLDPGASAQKHREAASEIWNVRESYLSLLADIKDPAFTMSEIRERRDDLQRQLHEVYKAAPHTTSKAYEAAQVALQQNEELTFAEEEIDALLPPALKRAQK